jgi:hypothetical protein
LNEASVSLATSAWTPYSAVSGETGIVGETTTQDGVVMTVTNQGFELLPPGNVSVQNNTISYTEAAARPEIDGFITFANTPVYAFGGDFTCQTASVGGLTSCTAAGVGFIDLDGVTPGASGFFGFVDTTGATSQLGQGILTCPSNPSPGCDAMWTVSSVDFALAATTAAASPEPNDLGLIGFLSLGGWWMKTRRRRNVGQ